MTRIAVIAPKAHQKTVIETLHDARIAHLEEYTREEGSDLDIGEPLEEGSRASELLVRLRSIIGTCQLEGEVDTPLTVTQIEERLETQLPEVEEQVQAIAKQRDTLQRELDGVHEELGKLRPLTSLPLRLEDYHGYASLKVLVGKAPRDLSRDLLEAIERFEYFASEQAHAVFVHEDEADKAREILGREGFRDTEVPEGEGRIAERVAALEVRAKELEKDLVRARERLVGVAQEHGDFLLAAEEHLSIQVEKAEAPLGFGSTERAFVVDAWVPATDVEQVRQAVERATDGCVHFEVIDQGDRDEHHRSSEPPVKYDHPKGVRRFSFFMDLFSRPSYDEIDPTIVLFLVFPLFFGFMIGDLGYGILMVVLGYYLYKRVGARSEAASSLGFALLLAGLWATLFGTIVFHDALGIPFAAHGEGGGLTWTGEHGLLGIDPHLPDPMLEKLGNEGVKSMLALSVLAAFVHLFVGFLFAFVNHLGHDLKHAFAQIGWMVTLTALFLLALLFSPANGVSGYLIEGMGLGTAEWTSHGVEAIHLTAGATNWPLYFIVPGLAVLVLTEGFMGVMETLGLFSNVISYTRLAGVAVAKGAMAGAFNSIFLQDMALGGASTVLVVVGFLLFVLAQLIVFVLGMISSAIQGIRLHYVEFFLKFYEGGGRTFAPFGREREYTLTPSTE